MTETKMNAHLPFQFDTLYIGGGTPSLLTSKEIYQIINMIYRQFRIFSDPEITIEVNPGTITFDQIKAYGSMGINRINIGVQSFQDKHLEFLTRIHSAKKATQIISDAQKAGFENIGIDLIYAIPGQTEALWLDDLKKGLEWHPAHLSCYMLTYESGTRLDNEREKGNIQPMDEENAARLFETTVAFLTGQGYVHYEISNFARSLADMSRHNRKYWSFVPYIGLGPSAHSFAPPIRYWNHRSVQTYLRKIQTGKPPIAEKERLTREQQIIEVICVGLRMREGIDLVAFYNRFQIRFEMLFEGIIKSLEDEGLITTDAQFCRLSQKGMLLLDSIAMFFVMAENNVTSTPLRKSVTPFTQLTDVLCKSI
jgi:oxygen-independent coproporphyrinogen-3 oxidase